MLVKNMFGKTSEKDNRFTDSLFYFLVSELQIICRIISDAALTPLPVKSVSTCPRPPGLHGKGEERQITSQMYL